MTPDVNRTQTCVQQITTSNAEKVIQKVVEKGKKKGLRARKERPKTWFMVGRLPFGYHGVLGALNLILTSSALLTLNPYQAICLQVFIRLMCKDAYQMVDQSPAYTHIFLGIVVDHRSAFRLTIDVCHYAGVRVIVKCLQQILAPEYSTLIFWVAFPAQLWRWWRLTPTQIYPLQHILTHKNPWLLLVPMGFGVTADMVQLLVGREDGVDLAMMLLTELLCLVIAFLFTMAFRKYIPVAVLYVTSLVVVWAIDSRLGYLLFNACKNVIRGGAVEAYVE